MNPDQPLKNGDYLYIEMQQGNSPTDLTSLQKGIEPYVPAIELFLWCLWILVLVFVLKKLLTISSSSNNNS